MEKVTVMLLQNLDENTNIKFQNTENESQKTENQCVAV